MNLSEDELEVLKKIIKREEAVSWLWGWVRSFLFVAAGGVLTLYSVFELWGKK